MESKTKIGSLSNDSILASRILDLCAKSPDLLNGLIDAREKEKSIVHRLDSEFKSQCRGDLGRYVTYRGYKTDTISSQLNIPTVSTKETLSVKYKFIFDTVWTDEKGNVKEERHEIEQDIPIPYKKYFMKINGHVYFAMYQLTDIIYKTKESCVIKTLQTPVKITRPSTGRRKHVSCDGKEIELQAPHYILDMFGKPTEFIKYFFAKMGVQETFEFFGLTGMISFVDVTCLPDRDDTVCFKMNKEVAVCINRAGLSNPLFRGFISTLLRIAKRKMNIYDAYSHRYWKCTLGEMFSRPDKNDDEDKLDKCEYTLRNLEKTIDQDTLFHLGLYAGSQAESNDIYASMRWLFMNFNKLIHNDNLHLNNKRLRLNEYITIPLLKRFSDKKNNFLKRPEHMRLRDIFGISDNIIMKEGIENNGVSRYVGLINDNIMLHVLMVTCAGPSAHGAATGSKKSGGRKHTIPTDSLFVHSSQLGVFDPNYAPAASAGINQILTTGTKISNFGVIESNIE